MRNLALCESVCVGDAAELADTQAITVDYDTKIVYCATSCGLYGLDPNTQQVVHTVSLVDGGYLPQDGSGRIVDVQHLPDQMALCVTTATGDVLLWSPTMDTVECVGSVASGLTAVAWSPDHQLVAMATGQQTLVTMTSEFDLVTEVSISPDNFGEAAFVTVGWGKKATQFHGSEGKQAATRSVETVAPASPWDDRQTQICWRGDGQYFAVSMVATETGSRCVRVWTRDSMLHATSEATAGLDQSLDWKPSGSLIASCQRRPNKLDVVFFEKNGLRHGEFTLPCDPAKVKVHKLLWNTDSTVLAVWTQTITQPPAPSDGAVAPPVMSIQLWTTANYHWYLKQSLPFSANHQVAALAWDPEFTYRLHVVCVGGEYIQYTWCWTTDHSPGHVENDHANVAVIDGDRVLLTPFRQMVVPPPLSAYHLQLPSAVNQVAFAPPPHGNDVAVVLDDGRLAVYTFRDDLVACGDSVVSAAAGGNGFRVQCPMPKHWQTLSIPCDDSPLLTLPLRLYHVTWVDSDKLIGCACNAMGTASVLYTINIDVEQGKLAMCCHGDVDGYILMTATNPETWTTAIQLTNGAVYMYTTDGVLPWLLPDGCHLSLPRPCTDMAVTTLAGQEVVVGRTDRFRLYVNDTEVASNCTSFVIHKHFLLLTTHAHTCRCIIRGTKVSALPALSDGKSHPFDESVRRVERGSRAVVVVTDDTKLVLQMPRGNLETIHPRALVLARVRAHLDSLRYDEAFTLMRRHRINMNLLYDHDPDCFLGNVATFVSQINSANHISLFLTDLVEEDVTMTMYTAAYERHHDSHVTSSRSKVDTVCDAVRRTLDDTDPDRYLLSILVAYVKKSRPELGTALKRIQTLKARPPADNVTVDGAVGGGGVTAEEALKYLLFLVDVNELYDVALGTYDFDLVLMVAEKSQKDPKEYLPFLNSLRKMDASYQRYTIDRHLKRYVSALAHIAQCHGKFSECLQLVEEQKLYTHALEIFPTDSQQYKDVAVAYGNHLTSQRRHEEAGLIFAKACAWLPATTAFQESGNWRLCLCMASKAGYTTDETTALARNLVSWLRDHHRHSDAACVCVEYLNDHEDAIATLIDGSQWDEALRLMHKYNRLDFIETNLKVALVDAHSHLVELIDTTRVQFDRHKRRLAVVREEKEQTRRELLEGIGDHNRADADLFSDTSSATGDSVISGQSRASMYSKTSGSSSKSRRKSERKKFSLKEGSRFEDVALMDALQTMYTRAADWKVEVAALLRMLVLFHYTPSARELQTKLDELLVCLDACRGEIWSQDNSDNTAIPPLGPDSTANAIAQAVQQGQRSRSQPDTDQPQRAPPAISTDVTWKLLSANQDTDR